jgi:3-dehydroquinate dehydratase type I
MEIVATFGKLGPGDPKETISHPPAGATLVEVRADLLPPSYPVSELVRVSRLPVILTLRSKAEGGQGPEDAASRQAFYREAAACGAAFYDLEAERDAELLGSVIPKEKAILSQHFDHTPADLEERTARLLSVGTRFVKVVPTARSWADVVVVLRLARRLPGGATAISGGSFLRKGKQGLPPVF